MENITINFGDEIIKVLDDLCEKFGLVIDWTSENVLPMIEVLLEKFIRYSTIMSGLGLGGSFMLIGIVVWLFLWIRKDFKETTEKKDIGTFYYCETKNWSWGTEQDIKVRDTYIGAVIIMCFLGVIGIVMFLVNIGSFIQLLVFPEMYVFEYLRGCV